MAEDSNKLIYCNKCKTLRNRIYSKRKFSKNPIKRIARVVLASPLDMFTDHAINQGTNVTMRCSYCSSTDIRSDIENI